MRPGRRRRRRTIASDQTVVQHGTRIQGSFDSKKGMCWGRFFAIKCAYTWASNDPTSNGLRIGKELCTIQVRRRHQCCLANRMLLVYGCAFFIVLGAVIKRQKDECGRESGRREGRKRRRRSEWKLNRDDFLRGIVMSLRADGGSIGGHTTNISVAAVRPMAYDATEYPLLSSLLFDLDIWTTERVGGRYAVHLCRVTVEKRPRAAITMYVCARRVA